MTGLEFATPSNTIIAGTDINSMLGVNKISTNEALTKDGVTYASYAIEPCNSEPRTKKKMTIPKSNIHFSSMEEGQLLSS